ncbi:MAG: hypothetical protein HY516_00695 [Candidatus Aenigmarchaeota archaeon]|nr:hypothetical protein [Candidatus Aenigmarchaeota archaeon]
MYTKNLNDFVLWAALFSALLMPLMAAAQPTSDDLRTSFAKILNVPASTMEGSNIVWFVLIPWALLFIIVFGILDEIKLFYKGGINFAIAFLATIMMIPTNVLGQVIIGIYGGGLSALAVIVGISIFPRFLERFGPRTGLPPVLLEVLSAVTYGVMMYFVFGFLTQSGGVLANYSWVRWLFTAGVPALVLFRGWFGVKLSKLPMLKTEEQVLQAEINADKDRSAKLTAALEALAQVASDKTAGQHKGQFSDAVFQNAAKVVLTAGGDERGWTQAYLTGLTSGQVRKLLADISKN